MQIETIVFCKKMKENLQKNRKRGECTVKNGNMNHSVMIKSITKAFLSKLNKTTVGPVREAAKPEGVPR